MALQALKLGKIIKDREKNIPFPYMYFQFLVFFLHLLKWKFQCLVKLNHPALNLTLHSLR